MATLDNQMLTSFGKQDSVSDLQNDARDSFHYNKNKYVNQIANQVINLGFDRNYAFNIADRAKNDSYWKDLIADEDNNINLIEGNFDATTTANYNPTNKRIPFEEDAHKIAFESVINDLGDDTFLDQNNAIAQKWAEYSKVLYNAQKINQPKEKIDRPLYNPFEGSSRGTGIVDKYLADNPDYADKVAGINQEPKTDKEFAQWGINHIGQLNYNLTALGLQAGDISLDDPDTAFSLYNMLDIYDKLPNNTKEGWGRFAEGVFTDPFTYMGLSGMYQAGKMAFGKKLGTETLKASLKNNLKKRFPMYAIGATEGAAFMGLDEFHRQTIGIKAEQLSKRDISQQLAMLGVGAVFGFATAGVADAAITGTKKAIKAFTNPKIDPYPEPTTTTVDLDATDTTTERLFDEAPTITKIESQDIQNKTMNLYSPSLLGIMNAVNDPNVSIPKKQLDNPNFHSGQYILKEANKFGLKLEELEYMGLRTHLESDDAKKITLKELQELIKDKPFPVYQHTLMHKDKLSELYTPEGFQTELEKNFEFDPFLNNAPTTLDDMGGLRFEHKAQLPKFIKPENLEPLKINPSLHIPDFEDFRTFLEDIFIPLRREGMFQDFSLSQSAEAGRHPNRLNSSTTTSPDANNFAYYMHPQLKDQYIGFQINDATIGNYKETLINRGLNFDKELTPYALHVSKHFSISDPMFKRDRSKNVGGIEDGLYPSKNEINVLETDKSPEWSATNRFTKMSLIDNFTNRFLRNLAKQKNSSMEKVYISTWNELWKDYGDVLIKATKFNRKRGHVSDRGDIIERSFLFSSFPGFNSAFRSIIDNYNTLLYSAGLESKLPQGVKPDMNTIQAYNVLENLNNFNVSEITPKVERGLAEQFSRPSPGLKARENTFPHLTLEKLSKSKNDPNFIQFRDQRLEEFQEKIRQAKADRLDQPASGRIVTPHYTNINVNDFLVTGLHWDILEHPNFVWRKSTDRNLVGNELPRVFDDSKLTIEQENMQGWEYGMNNKGHNPILTKEYVSDPRNSPLVDNTVKTHDQKVYDSEFQKLTGNIVKRLDQISANASNDGTNIAMHGQTNYIDMVDKDKIIDLYNTREFLDTNVTGSGSGTREDFLFARGKALKEITLYRDHHLQRHQGFTRKKITGNPGVVRRSSAGMSIGHRHIDIARQYKTDSGYSSDLDSSLIPSDVGKIEFMNSVSRSFSIEPSSNPREIILGAYSEYAQPKELARQEAKLKQDKNNVAPRGGANLYSDASAEFIDIEMAKYKKETQKLYDELNNMVFPGKDELNDIVEEILIREATYLKMAESVKHGRRMRMSSHFGKNLPKNVTEVIHALTIDTKYNGDDVLVLVEIQSDPQQGMRSRGVQVATPKNFKDLFKIAEKEERLLREVGEKGYSDNTVKLNRKSPEGKKIFEMLETSPFGSGAYSDRGYSSGTRSFSMDKYGSIASNFPFIGTPGDTSKPQKLMLKRLFSMAVGEDKKYLVITAPEYVYNRWKQYSGLGMLQAYRNLQNTLLNTAKELDPDAELVYIPARLSDSGGGGGVVITGNLPQLVKSESRPTKSVLDDDNPSRVLAKQHFEALAAELPEKIAMKKPLVKLQALYEIRKLLVEKGIDIPKSGEGSTFRDQVFNNMDEFLESRKVDLQETFQLRSRLRGDLEWSKPDWTADPHTGEGENRVPLPGTMNRVSPTSFEATPDTQKRVKAEASDHTGELLGLGGIGDRIAKQFVAIQSWLPENNPVDYNEQAQNATKIPQEIQDEIGKIIDKANMRMQKIEQDVTLDKEPMHVAIKITPRMKKAIENGQSLYSIPGLSAGIGGASLMGATAIKEQGRENGNTR